MQAKADESFRRSQRRAMSSYSRNPVIYQNRYVLPDDFDQTPSEGPLRADHYMRNQDIIEYITGMYDYKGDWEEWASEDLGEADKYFSVPYPSAAVYELGYGRQNEKYMPIVMMLSMSKVETKTRMQQFGVAPVIVFEMIWTSVRCLFYVKTICELKCMVLGV